MVRAEDRLNKPLWREGRQDTLWRTLAVAPDYVYTWNRWIRYWKARQHVMAPLPCRRRLKLDWCKLERTLMNNWFVEVRLCNYWMRRKHSVSRIGSGNVSIPHCFDPRARWPPFNFWHMLERLVDAALKEKAQTIWNSTHEVKRSSPTPERLGNSHDGGGKYTRKKLFWRPTLTAEHGVKRTSA